MLKSNMKRLKSTANKLKMCDNVIRDQVELGIVEPIFNLDQFLEEHPTASFLPHMGVFRMDNETTKFRIVYWSNLAEKSASGAISHNQALVSGLTWTEKLPLRSSNWDLISIYYVLI